MAISIEASRLNHPRAISACISTCFPPARGSKGQEEGLLFAPSDAMALPTDVTPQLLDGVLIRRDGSQSHDSQNPSFRATLSFCLRSHRPPFRSEPGRKRATERRVADWRNRRSRGHSAPFWAASSDENDT